MDHDGTLVGSVSLDPLPGSPADRSRCATQPSVVATSWGKMKRQWLVD
ncbi:MAG: hypothetical protein GY724_06625 [Actinomycetia bacterium]|nr:hypothetical protein [Actinomycetes bacterium]MCP5033213.1 hypothetical protein [Actinomycetes bacterium]